MWLFDVRCIIEKFEFLLKNQALNGVDWRSTPPTYYVDVLKLAPTQRCIPMAMTTEAWLEEYGDNLPVAWKGGIKPKDITPEERVSFCLVSTIV
jgi:hypothetical protein